MAQWRVQLFGPLLVLKDGTPVKLRTRQQGLLLARLLAYGNKGIQRAYTAELLWPEAEWSNAGAYLRRAIKELRELGIEIRSVEDRLLLDPEQVDSDLQGLLRGSDPFPSLPDHVEILEGWEHPIREEIRQVARHRLTQRSSPVRATVAQGAATLAEGPATGARSEDNAFKWIAETLVQSRPEVAMELLVSEWKSFLRHNPREVALSLALRVLAANPEITPGRLYLQILAGEVSILLTRFSLAKRLFTEALEGAEATGHDLSIARALSGLTWLSIDLRDWTNGLQYGRRAVEAAVAIGDPANLSMSWNNLAGLQWHTLGFEEAAENYRISWEAAGHLDERSRKVNRLFSRANSTYLWAVFGTEVTPEPTPFEECRHQLGYPAVIEAYLQFSSGFGHNDSAGAAAGVARMLELAADDMERVVCIGIDCAAFAFAMRGRWEEAAAAVRIGSRLRFQISHPRSPAEKLAVRRHVRAPLFGREVARLVAEWESEDIRVVQQQIGIRLRVPPSLFARTGSSGAVPR